MNLLEDRWIPVRLHDGSQQRVAPHELAGPQVAAFDAERADFNGALAQFAIGLLQTSSPVDSDSAWRNLLKNPPDAQTLQTWFAPHAAAFEFDGAGARFMQDFDLRATDGEPVAIGSLLIETPGENTIKNNSDHFVKRAHVAGLCSHCAALALFTLQVNAPAGGAGHRTGLRGGGPLTTLLVADGGPGASSSLWHTLWLNVRPKSQFLDAGGDAAMTAPHATFPWCASISSMQKVGGQTTPVQVHPAHVFWAMPRRIRLDLDTVGRGDCDLCGRQSERLVAHYVTRNYGLNYKGPWSHPLSPYYESKEGMLPVHPQPDGLGYRHWLGWALGMQIEKRKVERAPAIAQFLASERRIGIRLRLWAFGFDMDNMKARCWYEATVPLYNLADCDAVAQKSLREDIGSWLAGAEQASSYLRGAVKDAWFGGDARGDFGFIDASFWSRTEPNFYRLLNARIQAARGGTELDPLVQCEAWLKHLKSTALRLFDDELVGCGPVERMHPARVAAAHNQLRANLNGPKLRMALQLPVEAKPGKAAKAGKQATPATATQGEPQ
jgi:CRISPR system Cascade subunit CasA